MPTLAICGPSGVGKSTLSCELQARLESEGRSVAVIHQDDFFCTPKPASYWTCTGKETPDAVDMPALRSALEERRRASVGDSSCVIVVEGFLLLQDSEIMRNVDAVLFLQAPKAVCLQRRLARSQRSAHENEGLRRYFETQVWPAYEQLTAPALQRLLAPDAAEMPIIVLQMHPSFEVVVGQALRSLPELLPATAAAT